MIATMNAYYNELLKQVRRRDLSEKEITMVVAELQDPTPESNPAILLSILCYCFTQTKQYTPLIERYLNGPDDYLASEALSMLCSCWDLSSRYLIEILDFMEGTPPYEYQDRKRIAVSCAQHYLERNSSPRLLRQIINIFEDKSEDASAREAAYRALYVITGGDKWTYQSYPYGFNPETNANPVVVKLAKERLKREEEH